MLTTSLDIKELEAKHPIDIKESRKMLKEPSMDRKNYQKRQLNHVRSNRDHGRSHWSMTEAPRA